MQSNNEYLKRAEDFFEAGKKEYEYGLKNGDTLKIREGCEKVFHALVELSNAILSEHGIPKPKSHVERAEKLQQFGLDQLYDWTKERLHDTCYYEGLVRTSLLKPAIDSIEQEIKRRMI